MKTALHSLEEMAMARPSAIRKPRVFKDGTAWCALEGENLQDGVCGFGDTPDAACRQFDIQWLNERPNARSEARPVGTSRSTEELDTGG